MQAGNLPSLIADVRRNKALAAAMSAATITDASGNAVDLSALTAGDLEEADDDGRASASSRITKDMTTAAMTTAAMTTATMA